MLLLIIEFVSPGLFIAYEAEAALLAAFHFEKTYGRGLAARRRMMLKTPWRVRLVGSSYENGKYQALITITDKEGNETDRRIYSYNNRVLNFEA